ncbi:MAG TPA: von Willebrand factor type A domain-containing protein [Kofleriaceae bacterium]|nr:von Willebrand factor type A domain-containing protein [Kofleriaceae bacterium]
MAREPLATPFSTEDYHDWGKNPWIDTAEDHLSTFAADVDTASYTIARKKLEGGELPPPASVRVEEWVNYFHYAFPLPAGDSHFSAVIDAAPNPFDSRRAVLRVGVATPAKAPGERLPANLVFLVDVSGSMDEPDKLPLAKQALRVLVDHLNAHDTVALVTYAGGSRVILPRTSIDYKDKILAAIDQLESNGSTAMAAGLDTAYEIAAQSLKPGTTSRVIVCTDGDANVGPHSYEDLLKIIDGHARQGVTLSTIGFGMGNYKDTTMEQLADKGNGNNYYIDSPAAAERIFGEQLTSTLEVAAKDVKLQFDFDPQVVARYRLIGYENRAVADKDFKNDQVGGGQVGWGHQVTAMYEVELAHAGLPLGTLHIRHKAPDAQSSVEDTFAMAAPPADSLAGAAKDLQFAFAVAALADVLRGNADAQGWSLDAIRSLAADAAGSDPDRRELLGLIDRARKLRTSTVAAVAR